MVFDFLEEKKMRKITLLAMLMAALMVVPASASVQNIKISGTVDSTYLLRDNFDFGENVAGGDEYQSIFITQTQLQVDADLTDQVSVTVALINERAWEESQTSASTDVDLNLAFVTLREMLYSPLTVIIGRQAFSYGNSFIIDSAGANNVAPGDSGLDGVAEDLTKQTALDAIRLIFDYNPLTLEFLFAPLAQDGASGSTVADLDVSLWGANATYELGDDMDTEVEAYFFAKVDKSANGTGGPGNKTDKIYTPGIRVSTNPLEGVNVQVEYAHQSGSRAISATSNRRRDADAVQAIVNYQIPVFEEYKPVTQYTYTMVSGDEAVSGSSDHTAWDPLYENQHGGTIFNTLFDLTNLQIHSISLAANPMEDVSTKVTLTGLWQDEVVDAATTTLRQPGGSSVSAVSERQKALGHEIDVQAVFDYTEDVQFGANVGWFFPGSNFTLGNQQTASQAILNANVAF